MKSLDEGLTPARAVRIPDYDWHIFKAICVMNNTTPSDRLRKAVTDSLSQYPSLVAQSCGYKNTELRFALECSICCFQEWEWDTPEEIDWEEASGEYVCEGCNEKMYGDD